ncbi:MAG: VOC family protein [Bacteroidetes bacterium]|nr:VOC family protein [Bacteroidota bacterium]
MGTSINNSIRLTPYFTVEGANRFIDYMKNVFNASLVKIDYYADGSVQHGRLRIDDSVIMFNEAGRDYPSNKSQMHLYVGSVQKTYDLAIRHDSFGVMQPMRRPHGDLMAGFEDPFGNVWWVAEPSES